MFAKKKSVPFQQVTGKDHALEVRQSMRGQSNGIILLDKSFARGYDLKLGLDGKVFIVANGNSLKQGDVLQMIGRGCRS